MINYILWERVELRVYLDAISMRPLVILLLIMLSNNDTISCDDLKSYTGTKIVANE